MPRNTTPCSYALSGPLHYRALIRYATEEFINSLKSEFLQDSEWQSFLNSSRWLEKFMFYSYFLPPEKCVSASRTSHHQGCNRSLLSSFRLFATKYADENEYMEEKKYSFDLKCVGLFFTLIPSLL